MVLINDVNTQASGENERVGEREKKKRSLPGVSLN